MLNIADVQISNSLIQSPLAGYSDSAYRHLCIEYGCELTTTEMISVEGLWRESKATLEMLNLAYNEKHVSVQLFGTKPDSFLKAVDVLLKLYKPTVIDINAGCPAKKVIKTGSGCALMNDIPNAAEIVRSLKNHTKDIPITIKFRLGFDRKKGANYLDFASAVLNAGADAITLHSRFASDGYSGKAERDKIKELRSCFDDAVIIASGDVYSIDDVNEYISLGANGVMVARGGIGNPFIFKNIQPTPELKKDAYLRHLELLRHYRGEKAEVDMRKFYSHYFKKAFSGSLNPPF